MSYSTISRTEYKSKALRNKVIYSFVGGASLFQSTVKRTVLLCSERDEFQNKRISQKLFVG
jgi:hypothetical protein